MLGALVALLASGGGAVGASEPNRFDTIVIDAGHGGGDDGACGTGGLVEKDLVLDVARRLAGALGRDGLRVVMTRQDDTFVPLERRTWIANDARGDLFLSIHANASADRAVRGIETYFMSLRASDAAAQALAERENAAFGEAGSGGPAGGDAFLELMGDLITGDYTRDSDEFARLAQAELGSIEERSRGVKQAPFVVLANVQMPSSLVEIGFVTNASDERLLSQRDRRDAIVQALVRAIREFGRRYDARRGAAGEPPAALGGE